MSIYVLRAFDVGLGTLVIVSKTIDCCFVTHIFAPNSSILLLCPIKKAFILNILCVIILHVKVTDKMYDFVKKEMILNYTLLLYLTSHTLQCMLCILCINILKQVILQ